MDQVRLFECIQIPLFIDKVPSREITRIKDIDKYLHAAILEIDIKKVIRGSFRTDQGTSGLFPLSKLDNIDIKRICIVGPIPTTLINVIYFADQSAKDDFLSNFKSSNIVPPKDIKLWKYKLLDHSDEVVQGHLTDDQSSTENTPPGEIITPQIELTADHWHKVSAYGGALALAFSASKNGQKSSDKFQDLAFKPYLKNSEINTWNAGDDFSFIGNFLLSSPSQSEYNSADFKIQLYSGILNKICSADEGSTTKELVHFLTSGEFDDFGEKFGKFANSIARDIDCIHQTQYTTTPSEHLSSIRNDIINNKKTSLLSLGLAMLAFKDSAEKIIDYNQDDFEESDYFYFSLLAGMRAGLHKTPSYIRNIDGLNAFLSTKMAQMAHCIIDSDLKFKDEKLPETIIDMIESEYSRKFHSWITTLLGLNGIIARKIKAAEHVNIDMNLKEIAVYDFKQEMVEITDTNSYQNIMLQKKSKDIPHSDIYKKFSKK